MFSKNIYAPVSSEAKILLLVVEVWGSNPGSVKSDTCAATFLQSYVAQALSLGDEPLHLLHTSA